MTQIDASHLTAAILDAPCWARVGITAPTERMREQAARELARAICRQFEGSPFCDYRQLALPL